MKGVADRVMWQLNLELFPWQPWEAYEWFIKREKGKTEFQHFMLELIFHGLKLI